MVEDREKEAKYDDAVDTIECLETWITRLASITIEEKETLSVKDAQQRIEKWKWDLIAIQNKFNEIFGKRGDFTNRSNYQNDLFTAFMDDLLGKRKKGE